jgi:hypothetical protein
MGRAGKSLNPPRSTTAFAAASSYDVWEEGVLCYAEGPVFVVVEMLRGVVDGLEFLHYFVFAFAFVG